MATRRAARGWGCVFAGLTGPLDLGAGALNFVFQGDSVSIEWGDKSEDRPIVEPS